ncbi:squalene/phytoene synthase family protein [Streptomyces sp. R11]|uniref:Squalene/phytoene synthase family protein n=1 Tax=Streptomyces sp. R11 TaxID=3238625 RepID=A0AB39NEJ0_9ACTN
MRLLFPPELQPHVLTACAFVGHTDDLCDNGPVHGRADALYQWADQTRDALETGRSRQPLLAAYICTLQARQMPHTWTHTFLQGIVHDLSFHGFPTETDYQAYVDRITWPALMTTVGLLHPGGPAEETSAYWRRFADACQRLDFLADLAEDLRAGKLCLPQEDLDRHDVTRADLELGRDSPQLRALIAHTCTRARASLTDASTVLFRISSPIHHPLLHTLLELQRHRLDAIERRGSSLPRRPVGYGVLRPARTLLHALTRQPRIGCGPGKEPR